MNLLCIKAKEGDSLAEKIISAIVAAVVGFAIAVVSYLISKTVLRKNPQKYATTSLIRPVISVSFLVALYFVGDKLFADPTYLLIGGVLGMTVPMFFFTKKLLQINEAVIKNEKRGEDSSDG